MGGVTFVWPFPLLRIYSEYGLQDVVSNMLLCLDLVIV